jgi:hypothetical protein
LAGPRNLSRKIVVQCLAEDSQGGVDGVHEVALVIVVDAVGHGRPAGRIQARNPHRDVPWNKGRGAIIGDGVSRLDSLRRDSPSALSKGLEILFFLGPGHLRGLK